MTKITTKEQSVIDNRLDEIDKLKRQVVKLNQLIESKELRLKAIKDFIKERIGPVTNSFRKWPNATWRKSLLEFMQTRNKPVSRAEMFKYLNKDNNYNISVNNLSTGLSELRNLGWLKSSGKRGYWEYIMDEGKQ